MLKPRTIGRYEVVSALGQGAMGAVYKAVDPLIERTVAVKTINLGLRLSRQERDEFEARFYREAKSAGRLSHANIVTIYDVGEAEDVAFIAMEYLEGQTLREMLDSGVVLPVGRIAGIAARIAGALHYAHENHVVHRDVKPANIMVTPGHDVKIMDFGIAQMPTGSRTQLGTVLGSPKYMAPEQVAGQPTDGRTDIFALGVVLYEMLTGAVPFDGDNLSAIMYKVLSEEPLPPSAVDPRVPPAFDRIVARALAKRPEDRYQTAQELASDLSELEAVLPREAYPAVPGDPPARAFPAGHPADPQDATLFLPPRNAPGTPAIKPAAAGRKSIAVLLGDAQNRKPMLLAVTLLVIAAFMIYSQGPRTRVDAPETPLLDAPPRATHAATQATRGAPAQPTRATLTFAVSPWGEVYVDGKKAGVSPPLTRLKLQPGKHRLEIRNRGFAPYRKTLDLDAGQSIKIRHKFD